MHTTEDAFCAQTLCWMDRHRMLQKGDTVLAALSGGADSMALLCVLEAERERLGVRLRAVHVNHGLRGAQADADAAFVRAQCAARGVPLDEQRLSPPACPGEEWARNERYACFARLAQAHGAKVATAHTGSDNAETVLFRLARGSAARGAAGIPPVRGPYIRPLLWALRGEVEAYLARHGVPFVTDATNETDVYARNRVRHAVLPALECVHPGAARNLMRFAAEMTLLADELDARAAALLCAARLPEAPGLPAALPPAYDAALLRAAPAPVRRAALARLIAAAAPLQKTELTALADALLEQGAGALQLSEGALLRLRQGRLTVERAAPPRNEHNAWTAPFAPGLLCAPGGAVWEVRTFNYEKIMNSEKNVRKHLNFCADYDMILDNACFRTRRPGDRFRPAGRGVTKPLKKWFSEQKVPVQARELLPVLADGETVLWAAGLGFSECAACGEHTKTAVEIVPRQTEAIE